MAQLLLQLGDTVLCAARGWHSVVHGLPDHALEGNADNAHTRWLAYGHPALMYASKRIGHQGQLAAPVTGTPIRLPTPSGISHLEPKALATWEAPRKKTC